MMDDLPLFSAPPAPSTAQAPGTEGWHFFVPAAFTRALERLSTSRRSAIITASAFAQGDTFYDTPKAYLVWSEALQHIRRAIVVQADVAGMVSFRIHQTREGALRPTDQSHKLDAHSFLDFLRTGAFHS